MLDKFVMEPCRYRGARVTESHDLPRAIQRSRLENERNPALMIDLTGDGSVDFVLMDPKRRGCYTQAVKAENARAGRARDFCEASESQVWIHLSHCISLQHR